LALVAPWMPVELLVASLAHEALHAVQWAESGRPREWHYSAAVEDEAEQFGRAMAAAYLNRAA
jgi:hypothetical protein